MAQSVGAATAVYSNGAYGVRCLHSSAIVRGSSRRQSSVAASSGMVA